MYHDDWMNKLLQHSHNLMFHRIPAVDYQQINIFQVNVWYKYYTNLQIVISLLETQHFLFSLN
jgi:hypothetical protein